MRYLLLLTLVAGVAFPSAARAESFTANATCTDLTIQLIDWNPHFYRVSGFRSVRAIQTPL